MMKKAVLFFLMLPLVSFSQPKHLRVKSNQVKISFLADMQNTAGTIGGFKADIHFDTNNLSNSFIKGSVDVSTIDTGIEKRDEHLREEDFFHVAKYPKITFTSDSIKKEGVEYIMIGQLQIKDIKGEEKIIFTFSDNIFRAESTIKAANYGIFEKKGPDKTKVKITFAIPVH